MKLFVAEKTIIQSRKIKVLIFILFFIFMGLSFIYHLHNNETEFTKLFAPINVNVELEKNYENNIVLMTNPHDEIINLMSADVSGNNLTNKVIHTEINKYIMGLTIRVPVNENHSISFIDNISVFVGNKLFYFDFVDIAGWEGLKSSDYTDYNIPLGMYKKSLIKPWINWYGDLNYILQITMELITQPHKYFLVYFFGLIILLLFYRDIYSLIAKNNKKIEIILLLIILAFGFLIRINAIERYSAWVDELWSAVLFSNPNQPIFNVLKDPGNPPLYYFLLRIWFSMFGWTETTGRLFSSIIGTIGIVTLYWFVKSICGKKYAFISAFLLTISYTSVGHSGEMRAYILLIMLCPLVSLGLLKLLEKADLRNSIIYMILGILLVNTHYYGVLYIIGNFVFYFIHKRYAFQKKETTGFLLINVLIAISFMPFFFMTALHYALLDNNFNSWIPKPGKTEYVCTFILLLLYILVRIIAIVMKKKLNEGRKITLFHYSFFVISFIYISAFAISLYRPILVNTYLSICIPLIIIILTFFVTVLYNILAKSKIPKKPAVFVSIIFFAILSNFIANLRYFGGGNSDAIKESINYIAMDSANHSSAAQINTWWWNDDLSNFYSFTPLPHYDFYNANHDVLYLPVFHTLTNEIVEQELIKMGISGVNRIRLSQNRYLIKTSPPR